MSSPKKDKILRIDSTKEIKDLCQENYQIRDDERRQGMKASGVDGWENFISLLLFYSAGDRTPGLVHGE